MTDILDIHFTSEELIKLKEKIKDKDTLNYIDAMIGEK